MARIVGVDIPNNKRVVIALTYIHGIGDTSARNICKMLGFPQELRAKDLKMLRALEGLCPPVEESPIDEDWDSSSDDEPEKKKQRA